MNEWRQAFLGEDDRGCFVALYAKPRWRDGFRLVIDGRDQDLSPSRDRIVLMSHHRYGAALGWQIDGERHVARTPLTDDRLLADTMEALAESGPAAFLGE